MQIKQILINKLSVVCLIGFVSVSLGAVMYCIPSGDYGWYYIIWNYFLAVLPAFFALCAKYFFEAEKTVLTVISSLLWLLFFPNSPYMLTDLKYISNVEMNTWDSISLGQNLVMWLFLLNIAVSVFTGVLVGLLSLYEMHSLAKRKFPKAVCWLFVVAASVLSSFGVYIGRFSRVNSWDILQPMHLFSTIFSYMNEFTVKFVAAFALATIFMYLPVYFLSLHYKKSE